jgi:hypothetical protein
VTQATEALLMQVFDAMIAAQQGYRSGRLEAVRPRGRAFPMPSVEQAQNDGFFSPEAVAADGFTVGVWDKEGEVWLPVNCCPRRHFRYEDEATDYANQIRVRAATRIVRKTIGTATPYIWCGQDGQPAGVVLGSGFGKSIVIPNSEAMNCSWERAAFCELRSIDWNMPRPGMLVQEGGR